MSRILLAAAVLAALATWKLRRDASRFVAGEPDSVRIVGRRCDEHIWRDLENVPGVQQCPQCAVIRRAPIGPRPVDLYGMQCCDWPNHDHPVDDALVNGHRRAGRP